MNRYVNVTVCSALKCGEYNILQCVRPAGHDGDHNYVVCSVPLPVPDGDPIPTIRIVAAKCNCPRGELLAKLGALK